MTEPIRHKPRVIIESPMFTRADGTRCSPAEVERNMRYLKRATLDSLRRGEAPFASCLIYPQVLDDALPEERRLGIEAGFAWGEAAHMFAVYADHGISDGTKEGLTRHEQNGMAGEYRHIGAEPWPQIASDSYLVHGRWYRITEISRADLDPSLKVGDVVKCAEDSPNCISHEPVDGQWFADYDGEGAYRTLVTGLEEVGAP